MRYLLLYDIVPDSVRTKVADACLDYGLERVQYSAFLGELSRTHLRELWVQLEKRIGKSQARVHLYPLDEQCWSGRRIVEQMEEERRQ